mmetsp:Transcript_41453/g.99320  ORF Transcript_41453/g.99320 Transcript_41453/m.99320 type:complete len:237 (+) Transcript_41453:807-1517(+)
MAVVFLSSIKSSSSLYSSSSSTSLLKTWWKYLSQKRHAAKQKQRNNMIKIRPIMYKTLAHVGRDFQCPTKPPSEEPLPPLVYASSSGNGSSSPPVSVIDTSMSRDKSTIPANSSRRTWSCSCSCSSSSSSSFVRLPRRRRFRRLPSPNWTATDPTPLISPGSRKKSSLVIRVEKEQRVAPGVQSMNVVAMLSLLPSPFPLLSLETSNGLTAVPASTAVCLTRTDRPSGCITSFWNL